MQMREAVLASARRGGYYVPLSLVCKFTYFTNYIIDALYFSVKLFQNTLSESQRILVRTFIHIVVLSLWRIVLARFLTNKEIHFIPYMLVFRVDIDVVVPAVLTLLTGLLTELGIEVNPHTIVIHSLDRKAPPLWGVVNRLKS